MDKLSKKQRLLQYRKQSRLPRYDLAVKQTSSGYQPFDYTQQQTSLTPGQDISGEIDSLGKEAVTGSITKGVTSASLPSTLANVGAKIFTNTSYKTLSAAGTEIAKQAGAKAAADAFAKEVATRGADTIITGTANNIAASTIAKTAGTKATSKAFASTAAGTVARGANIVAAAYGTYDMIKGWADMANDVRSTKDMMDTSSRQTVYRNGVAYEKMGGVSPGDEISYGHRQNTASWIKNGISGALAGGAAAGAIAGSIVPGIGTAIGAAAGALISAIGSFFAGGARMRKIRERIDRTSTAIENANRQSESIAASQGLQNQFNQNAYADNTGMFNANRGFNPSQSAPNNTGIYKQVWTPEGKQYGEQGSWVGKGESMLDYNEGKASVVKQGKVGVDSVPSSAKEGDTITIAGNDIDWKTGNTFAKEVEPYARVIEKINKKERAIQNSKASDKTMEINMFNLRKAKEPYLAAAKQLTDRQQLQHQIEGMYTRPRYACGKPGYSLGKIGEIAMQYAPYVLSYLTANNQYNTYKKATPTAYNSYQVNPYAQQALGALAQMYYDPTQELNVARDAYRQQLYINNNAGSLSAGQRAALNNALGIGLMRNKTSVLQNARKQNAEYRKAWATSALAAGEQEAARKQQAQAAYNDQLASSYAARLKGMETAQNAKMNIFNTFAKQLFDQSQYAESRDLYKQMASMYNKQ